MVPGETLSNFKKFNNYMKIYSNSKEYNNIKGL